MRTCSQATPSPLFYSVPESFFLFPPTHRNPAATKAHLRAEVPGVVREVVLFHLLPQGIREGLRRPPPTRRPPSLSAAGPASDANIVDGVQREVFSHGAPER